MLAVIALLATLVGMIVAVGLVIAWWPVPFLLLVLGGLVIAAMKYVDDRDREHGR